MKAYVLNKIGDLSYQDVPKPELKKDWALIKVKAAGICSSDIPRIYERGTYHFPTIPGHEFAGDVVKVNGEKYTDIVGKRVSVFPLIPCGKCSQCKKKMYEMCENYDYIGSRRNGGFAEYVEVPVWNLIELGENISYESAALMEPLSVALHAIRKANISKNNSIASEYVIDISYKDDLYEYLAAVDVAVTDYSSVAFDAAYMKIPVFLYVDDYKEYVEDRGDLLWRYEEIPFPIATNNKELTEKIIEFNYDNYMKKLQDTFENIGLLEDGNATERVLDIIKTIK